MTDRPIPQMIARRTHGVRHWVDKSSFVEGMPDYDPEVLGQLVELIAVQGHSLKKICTEKMLGPDTPNLSTVFYWRRCDPRVTDIIDAARCAAAETKWAEMEEEVNRIFDEASGGGATEVMAATARAKLLFDLRKFEVSHLVTRVYGGQKKTAKDDRDLKSTIEAMERDGKVVVVQLVEVPAKNPPPVLALAPPAARSRTKT